MKKPRSTALRGLLVLGAFVAGCERVPTPTEPSATTQFGQPDPALRILAAPPQQGGASVDWPLFIARSAGPARISALGLTTAADAPGGVSNLTFNTASSTVSLSWTAPSGGDPPTSYVVEAGSAPGRVDIATFDTGSALTFLSVNNVPSGQYFVRVRARNSAGFGPPSNEVQITVGACAVPAAPTNLRSCVAGTSVNLTWTGSAGAASYFLEAGSSPGASNLFARDVGPGTALTTLAVPGTYYIRVKARTPCGISAASNEIVITVGGVPVVDQSFLPPFVAPNIAGMPNFTGLAQTFTVGMSGGLSDVALRFGGSYSNVRMQIRSTSGGIPTAQVLADTIIPTIPPGSAPVRVNVSSFGICVNAGDILAIVLPPVSAGNSSTALWNVIGSANATYGRGQGFRAADTGASSPITMPVGGNFAFETYVTR